MLEKEGVYWAVSQIPSYSGTKEVLGKLYQQVSPLTLFITWLVKKRLERLNFPNYKQTLLSRAYINSLPAKEKLLRLNTLHC